MFLLQFPICVFLSLLNLVYNADVTAQELGGPLIPSRYPAAQSDDGPYVMSSPGIIGVGLELVEKLTGGILPVGELMGSKKSKKKKKSESKKEKIEDNEESDEPETVLVLRGRKKKGGHHYAPRRERPDDYDRRYIYDDYGDDGYSAEIYDIRIGDSQYDGEGPYIIESIKEPYEPKEKRKNKEKDKDATSDKTTSKPEKEKPDKNTTKLETTTKKKGVKKEGALESEDLDLLIDKLYVKSDKGDTAKDETKKAKPEVKTMSADDEMFPSQVLPGRPNKFYNVPNYTRYPYM